MEADGEHLRLRAASGVFPPLDREVDVGLEQAVSRSQHIEKLLRSQPVRKGAGVLGEVAEFGTAILIEDAELDERVPTYDVDFLKVTSVLAVPLRFRHRAIGVLAVVNRIDAAPFSPADLNLLQALADHTSVSVHYAILRDELDAKRRIDRDLSLAHEIQALLLPKEVPAVPGLELAAFSVPARKIGGDYYDFFRIDEEHLGIVIADVSGKGVGAGMVMSICRTVLRSCTHGVLRPEQAVCRLNEVLARDLAEDMFVTLLYVVIDLQSRRVSVARAGHERPLAWRASTARVEPLESVGLAIGVADDETFSSALGRAETTMAPGDLLVLYTDGVTEAMDPKGEEWGVAGLRATLEVGAARGADAVVSGVRERLLRFVGDRPPHDDMTLVALQWTA